VKRIPRQEVTAGMPSVLGFQVHEAAAFIGIGVTSFRELVKVGTMPPPRLVGGVMVWDHDEVRSAFKDIAHIGGDASLPVPEGIIRDTSWDDA